MSELFCEEVAHRAGFIVSVGNWIAPNGFLILGETYKTHHWETLQKHLDYTPKPDNHLEFMNQKINEGYFRLVFRNDVLFQVSCKKKEEIWGENPNIKTMKEILGKIPDIEIHIFSKSFYLIGLAKDILDKKIDRLQIQEI